MKTWFLNNKLTMIGLFLGAIVGYAYYFYIGCQKGTCIIGSKPINSTAYFAVMGAIALNLFKKKDSGTTN